MIEVKTHSVSNEELISCKQTIVLDVFTGRGGLSQMRLGRFAFAIFMRLQLLFQKFGS